MAPTRSKKQRKSAESASSVDIQSFPVPPQMMPIKTRSPNRTPPNKQSPIRKQKMGITLGQKQALIDNLQLELTERARKLRAQYNLQAQGLRTRIEIRVNRIPTALRKAKMGDLFQKDMEKSAKSAAGPSRTEKINSPSKNLIQEGQSHYLRASPPPHRSTKRLSEEISIDKENADIENPKKRLRRAPAAPAHTTSRAHIKPSQVLSPRSANSRTLPHSPIRSASPTKTFVSRPISPLKPNLPASNVGAAGILTHMVERAKTTRSAATRKATETATAMGAATRKATKSASTAGGSRGKMAAPSASAPRVGRGKASYASDSSSSTTIVRKPVAAPAKKPPTKKTVMSTLKGMSNQKKTPAAKKATTASTAPTGGRVLRKRN